jgi:Leucine-rich repeat (LRR) protein
LTVEKLLRRSTATSKIDFDDLVKKHGFIKARQLIKRSTIQQHQQDVEEEEKNVHASHEQQRIRETMLLSTTQGGSSTFSMLDKLMMANRGITAIERSLLDSAFGTNSLELLSSIKRHEQNDMPRDEFLKEDRIHYALTDPDKELLIANADIEELPMALSDTLHLQTAYLRKINCTRNKITTLTSSRMPQFSFYHLRYVKSINLSLNKIKRLPDNFGALKFLEELNLSDNMLSKLPASVFNLKSLTTLDLSCNNFVGLPDEFSNLSSLTNLNLSQNLFISFPYPVCRLISIKVFKFSRNTLNNLAILPPLLKKEDMFIKTYDQRSGKQIFVNILTKEKVSHIEKYSGAGLKRQQDIHTFQSEDPKNILYYRRRKMWLSVCQINEWDPDFDVATGQLYYKNNVSGSTSWEMPAALDNIGLMSTLQEFEIRNNAIKFLPTSFSSLSNLKRVAFTRNRLKELPEEIGHLKLLEYLDLASNELKLLPTSICSCTSLEELNLEDNHLIRLPQDLGFLPNLQRLNLTANRLKKVPFSLGYCKTLKSIRVAENPIEDPPIEEFDKNIEHILWYLRNKFMIDKHGMPPMMQYHTIGIQNEVTILEQELLETVHQKIEASKKDGILNLQLLGLKEIPKLVLKMPKLQRLKLDFNDRLQITEFPIEFRNIDGLSFKSCKMPHIPENIYIFERLSSLNLEDNRLEFLPAGIVEVYSLTNLSKCCIALLSSIQFIIR